jgi:hypothetical protein
VALLNLLDQFGWDLHADSPFNKKPGVSLSPPLNEQATLVSSARDGGELVARIG